MSIKTSQQYLESLKKLKPTVYIIGEKVDNVVENKHFHIPLKEMCKWYDWPSDPEKKEISLIGHHL